ncbi:hypothetical protein [Caballeronia sp. LZ019]|nr:hypothetical protein [Caballeronia sp. LZ019]MDR5808003.1 hypothetical protein [Caballeronia sp. LZ019]
MFYEVDTRFALRAEKLLSLVAFFAWDQSKALKRQLWSTAKKGVH